MKRKPATVSKISPLVIKQVLRRERLFTLLDHQSPTRSFSYFGQAAASLMESPAWQMPLLTPEYLPSLETFVLGYFDYFSAEILEKVSCSLYHFLLQSVHLPHMTAEMASELTDMAAADILLTLKRKKGWKKGAINLYAQTGAYESAASIILNVAPALIAKRRDTTLSACIELLPDEYIQKNPWLLLWQDQAQMTRNAPVSQTLCTTAFNMFNTSCDVSGQILSWATAVEIFFIVRSGFTDLDLCIKAGEHLAHLLPAGEDTAELTGRLAASMLLALLLFGLGHPDLKKWQERCEVLLERCNDLQVTVDLMKNLFLSCQWLGQVHEAQRMEDRQPVLGNAGNVPPRVQVTLSYTLTLAAFIAGDQRRCMEKGVETFAVADKTGIHI